MYRLIFGKINKNQLLYKEMAVINTGGAGWAILKICY